MKKDLKCQRPTAPVIAARLCKSWGGRIALLFRQGDLYFEDGEEVPIAAIDSWQEVSLPEVESEDERIRKRLIECLKLSLKGAVEQDAAGCSREKDIEAYKWGIALLEKQKEQKYQTEGTVFEVGETITDGTSVFTIVDIKDGHYIADDGDKVCFYVAHKYYTLCKEQKPVEWSEEDEENLDAAIDMAEHTLYEPLVPRDTLVSWLKSLKDRIKWK